MGLLRTCEGAKGWAQGACGTLPKPVVAPVLFSLTVVMQLVKKMLGQFTDIEKLFLFLL